MIYLSERFHIHILANIVFLPQAPPTTKSFRKASLIESLYFTLGMYIATLHLHLFLFWSRICLQFFHAIGVGWEISNSQCLTISPRLYFHSITTLCKPSLSPWSQLGQLEQLHRFYSSSHHSPSLSDGRNLFTWPAQFVHRRYYHSIIYSKYPK